MAKDDSDIVVEGLKTQIRQRYWRGLNILSITVLWFVVYAIGMMAELLLSVLFAWTFPSEANSGTMALFLKFFKIAAFVVSLMGMLVHILISTYTQIKTDWEMTKEGTSPQSTLPLTENVNE